MQKMVHALKKALESTLLKEGNSASNRKKKLGWLLGETV